VETSPAILDFLVNTLHENGYRGYIEGTAVFSAASGFSFYIIGKHESGLQIRCAVDREQYPDFTSEHVNAFNANYRFIKSYIQEEDIIIETDHIVDFSAENAQAICSRAIFLFDGAIGFFRTALTEARREKQTLQKEATT